MSETATGLVADGRGDTSQGDTIAVQRREITEAAFRALYAAGADPLEAQEGASAVLGAEVDRHGGLRLLEQLLDADWSGPTRAARVERTPWEDGDLRDLDTTGEPPLRAALQLLDLAADEANGQVHVARAAHVRVPRALWADLVLRHTARIERRIVVATDATDATDDAGCTDGTAGTAYLTVDDGVLSRTSSMPPTASAASMPPLTSGGVAVMVLPDPAASGGVGGAGRGLKPVAVREGDWQRMYQLSRSYLVADA